MEVISGKIDKAKKVVLYGPEGIGKSSLASQFPSPIFIDTEGSTTELIVDRLKKPSSWTELNQQVDWVKNQAGKYKTLVIDTVDWAERLTIEFVTSRSNKQSITNFGYGEGFIQLEEEFGKFLNRLSDLVEIGINVVLTAHAKITKFEQPDEMGAYDRYELKLGNKTTAKTAALTKEWADMVLFINYKTFSVATDDKGKKHKGQGGIRTIFTTHHPAWDAKNRHGLPDEISLDYANIAHIFNSVVTSPQIKTNTAPPVTEPQVTPPTQQEQQMPSDPLGAPIPPVVDTTGASKLDPAIPQALRDLMSQNSVSEEEIQVVVSNKGYYPMGTPIANYDPGFVNGVLVGAWEQVFNMVKDFRNSLPFS
ncbi:energy-coupling factor transporter ATP-binding protein EcfA2 [Cytobacillus horneckiae]|uniref:ATP-binding protein n=1 Tax=Cytobacillus horneckiae TaxID=549687 RepID=UPI0019D29ABD|nr:ATP-binding protein [Cytobacillus horneckiae]MBN6886217.1 ATP-binding protein [Cytobacillus horneckiae]